MSDPAPPRTRRSANPLDRPDPTRVLVAGEDGLALASAATPIADDERPLLADDGHGPRAVDAVLIGDQAPALRRLELSRQASDAGVPVLQVPAGPVLDVRETNPAGWRRETSPTIGVRVTAEPGPARSRALEEVLRRVDVARLVLLTDGPRPRAIEGVPTSALPDDPRGRRAALASLRGAIDHPDLHATTAGRAAWLVEAAARGVPTVTVGPLGDRLHLAPPLRAALQDARVADLDEVDRRELLSTRQRRAALRHHGAPEVCRALATDAGLPVTPLPTVSVVLATNQPEHLRDAVRRIDRQSYPEVEIVVALHGDGFPERTARTLRRLTRRPLEVVAAPSSATLGEVLNLATGAASGELLAKMDDDDLYDVDHLLDLTDALRYSGATLVGKGSEFVYLAELDTTIRRFPTGAESANRNLAGGTLLLGRGDLAEAGGWQRARRAVDQRLIDDVLRTGGRVHRTHGFGFVLNRHDAGHTWEVSVDYFLRQAVTQWRGLALGPAGVR